MTRAEVIVRGEVYTGWQELSVQRALDAAAGAFELRSVAPPGTRWPIRPGDEVVIQPEGVTEPLVTGYVDSIEAESVSDRTSLVLRGRDRTADLVDSSAPTEPGEWSGLRLEELAREIAEPFGVPVVRLTAAGEPFERFAVQQGETAWAAIERAARSRGAILYTDGKGQLVLDQPGSAIAEGELVEGETVTASRLSWTLAERFRAYTVKAQRTGSDQAWGEVVSGIQGVAQDEEVQRERGLVIIAEGAITAEGAKVRAQREAAWRRANSLVVTVTAPLWLQGGYTGPPWRINEQARTKLPTLTVDEYLLVRSVTFTRTASGGSSTELLLAKPDAFDLVETIPEGSSGFDELIGGFDDDFSEGDE